MMFKMRDDSHVTPIGRFIRRYSINEFPQLFNIFLGQMSRGAPRPSLERELSLYETQLHRGVLAKPGAAGLRQVSGRSNLSWEDSVWLDGYCMTNWSIPGDLVILRRTARAVLASDGVLEGPFLTLAPDDFARFGRTPGNRTAEVMVKRR